MFQKSTFTEYFTNQRSEMMMYIPSNAKKIIEIGCGQGTFIEKLASNKRELWGVEPVEDIAKIAKKKLDKILVCSIEEALEQLPKNYFDCIIFNDVLEHLIDTEKVLDNLKPYLSKNGVIVASIPNVRWFKNLINLVVKKDWEYQDSGILDRTHLRFFTEKSIQNMFKRVGYEINIEGINRSNGWKSKLLNVITLGFFNDSFYLQFAVVAKVRK